MWTALSRLYFIGDKNKLAYTYTLFLFLSVSGSSSSWCWLALLLELSSFQMASLPQVFNNWNPTTFILSFLKKKPTYSLIREYVFWMRTFIGLLMFRCLENLHFENWPHLFLRRGGGFVEWKNAIIPQCAWVLVSEKIHMIPRLSYNKSSTCYWGSMRGDELVLLVSFSPKQPYCQFVYSVHNKLTTCNHQFSLRVIFRTVEKLLVVNSDVVFMCS